VAPPAANRRHVAAPIPEPPPVTTTTRPSKVVSKLATAGIVAAHYPRRVMDDEDARAHLQAEHERLQRLQSGFEAEHLHDEGGVDATGELSKLALHQADSASETFEREKDFSILEEVEAELADVERALARLDDGSYGTCEACGDVIGDARLEVLPAARFCIDHQQQAETRS
jgi:RNA polymerase-binding transcription factor DksA